MTSDPFESSAPLSDEDMAGFDMADFDLESLDSPAKPGPNQPPDKSPDPFQSQSQSKLLPLDTEARRPQQMVSTRALVETAFLASTTALIWLVQFYLQLWPVLRIFFAIPVAIAYMRWNRRTAWMTCIVSTLLLSVLLGPPRGLQFVMPFGFLGVLLGGLWKRNRPWWVSMVWGSLLYVVGQFFQIGLLSILSGDNLWLYANQQGTSLFNWLMSLFGWMWEANVLAVQALIVCLYFVNAIIYNFTVHLIAYLLFERLGNPIPEPPEWVQALVEYQD
jgi:uncharacterized protein YybS (DUF2232 family)